MGNSVWLRGNAANLLCMSCHMSATLLPLYWKKLGFQDWQIGWLAAGFSLAAIVARFRLGAWLERWGRRPFLMLGAALLTLLSGIYLELGAGFLPWLLVRGLQGLGLGFFITAVLTWVADRSPPDRVGQRQGVFGVSGLLGSAIGPMVCESIYRLYGFPAMFQTLCGAGLVALALAASLPESRPPTEESTARSPSPNFKLAEHRSTLWVTLPFGWFVGTVVAFVAPLVESVDLPHVGLYFVGFALASVTVRVVSGSFIDRVGITRLVQVSGGLLALSGLATSALIFYPTTPVLFSAAILNGIGHGFLFPGLSSHTVRKTSIRQRAAGMALFTGVFDGGVLLGSVVSGYVAQAFNYSTSFFLASLLLLLSLSVFGKLERMEPEPSR